METAILHFSSLSQMDYVNNAYIKGVITKITIKEKYTMVQVMTKIGIYTNYPSIFFFKEKEKITELHVGNYVEIYGEIESYRDKKTGKHSQSFVGTEINKIDKHSTNLNFHMYENAVKLRGIVNKISDKNKGVILMSLLIYSLQKNKWDKIFVAGYGKTRHIIKKLSQGDIVDLLANIQTVQLETEIAAGSENKNSTIITREPLVLQSIRVYKIADKSLELTKSLV